MGFDPKTKLVHTYPAMITITKQTQGGGDNMHPYWILPIVVGLGGLLLSVDQVYQGHVSTGMNTLIISFTIIYLLFY